MWCEKENNLFNMFHTISESNKNKASSSRGCADECYSVAKCAYGNKVACESCKPLFTLLKQYAWLF